MLRRTTLHAAAALLASLALVRPSVAQAPPLPPVPVPAENPVTEAKRLLGKALFWDEQLSSDDSVACGTCHLPELSGSDDRVGLHPGADEAFGTPDDVTASPGVAAADSSNRPVEDESFGFSPQVTPRATQAILGTQFAGSQFWDGRALGIFEDPETGDELMSFGGALESQALGPILSEVEMAHRERSWDEVRRKLARVRPLALASELPPDLEAGLTDGRSYGDLFEAAFGDPEITASRIAYAIATYERTLIPDQTPWDLFNAGDPTALTPAQANGLNVFRTSPCNGCHRAPTFTDNLFHAVGQRPWQEDPGRMDVTGDFLDRGKFKTPTLRGVGLKSTFMHSGQLTSLEEVLDFYQGLNGLVGFPENRAPGIPFPPFPPGAVADLLDFLRNGLTDPRVAAGDFPFDRPTLRSELPEGPALRLRADALGGCELVLQEPAGQVVDGYRAFRGTFPAAPGGGLAVLGSRGMSEGRAYDHSELDCGLLAEVSDFTPAVDEPGSFYYLVAAVSPQGCHGLGRSFVPLPGGESVRSEGRPHPSVTCEPCLP